MENNPLSDSLLSEIKNRILEAKAARPGPHYAAFDADGTLWDSDLGEQFFQYQIDHCDLKALQGVDAWDRYDSMKKENPIPAYLWLAQISAGHSLEQVRAWAQEAVEKKGANVFASQKKLIAWLQSQDIEVFIVTASIQWAVEPAGRLVGIPFENVLGIQTEVDSNGIVTKKQHGPITWRAGKAEALLERTNGVRPVFCSGNTYGDIALLETSIGERLCIQTQIERNGLFEEEVKLREHAHEHGWRIHNFSES